MNKKEIIRRALSALLTLVVGWGLGLWILTLDIPSTPDLRFATMWVFVITPIAAGLQLVL